MCKMAFETYSDTKFTSLNLLQPHLLTHSAKAECLGAKTHQVHNVSAPFCGCGKMQFLMFRETSLPKIDAVKKSERTENMHAFGESQQRPQAWRTRIAAWRTRNKDCLYTAL